MNIKGNARNLTTKVEPWPILDTTRAFYKEGLKCNMKILPRWSVSFNIRTGYFHHKAKFGRRGKR